MVERKIIRATVASPKYRTKNTQSGDLVPSSFCCRDLVERSIRSQRKANRDNNRHRTDRCVEAVWRCRVGYTRGTIVQEDSPVGCLYSGKTVL